MCSSLRLNVRVCPFHDIVQDFLKPANFLVSSANSEPFYRRCMYIPSIVVEHGKVMGIRSTRSNTIIETKILVQEKFL